MTDTPPSTQSRRRGLGRGLDALLGGPVPALAPDSAVAPPAGGETSPTSPDTPVLIEVNPGEVRPNPEQPRHHFDAAALAELTESIRVHGVLHPIVVERVPSGGYQLVAGERRWRAAQAAGVTLVPAIVRPAAESARHALELALTENLVRADLSPLEEAAAYSRLADTFGLTHEAIALRVGRSRAQVSNTIRLLQLPAGVQEALAEGRISAGHARALLALPDETAQEAMAATAERRGLSVRDVEKAVAARAAHPGAPDAPLAEGGRRPAPAAPAPADEALRRGFEEALGVPVQIQRSGRGGRVVIEFFADEDLDALYERIGGRPL